MADTLNLRWTSGSMLVDGLPLDSANPVRDVSTPPGGSGKKKTQIRTLLLKTKAGAAACNLTTDKGHNPTEIVLNVSAGVGRTSVVVVKKGRTEKITFTPNGKPPVGTHPAKKTYKKQNENKNRHHRLTRIRVNKTGVAPYYVYRFVRGKLRMIIKAVNQ